MQSRLKLLISSFLISLIGALLLLQINVVLAIASDENNPITAAITSAINDIINPDPTPNNPDSTPTPEPSSDPTPSADPISIPITDPITEPSPTPSADPITIPVVNPTPDPNSEPVISPITEPTPTHGEPAQSNDNSASQPSSGGGSPQAPVCGDSKPVSTPKLVYAHADGRNQVTLVWSKALDPVSYYLVAYGTKSGQMEYGNPNIGGKDTISYAVKGLDNGKTYYFKVRAGNGCMPGDFSNEIAVKVSGDKVSGPAAGFKAGVLGSKEVELPFQPITEAKTTHITTSGVNLFTRILNFLARLFGR